MYNSANSPNKCSYRVGLSTDIEDFTYKYMYL